MDNIVDLVQEIIQNDHFKFLLKDSVERIFQNSSVNSYSNQKQTPTYVKDISIIDEINQSILSITKANLMKQTTSFYISLMQKNDQLIAQQQIQYENSIKQKFTSLRQQLIEELKELYQKQKLIQKNSKKSIRTQQRKVLGQSILNCNNMASQKHFKIDTQYGQARSELQISIDNGLTQRQSFRQFGILSQKLTQFERSNNKLQKDFYEIYKRKIQTTQNELKKLTSLTNQMKFTFQQNMQASFAGLWNVISNIQQKFQIINKAIKKK